jgi:hypothetical protein
MMPPDELDLELELHRALARVEPGKDFSALRYSRWPARNRLLTLAAAIVLLVLLPVGGIEYRARQQRREEARAELIQALRITQSKLQKTQQMVIRQLDRRNAL